ncbi:16S rRNA (cytidine(1402)-2'-O)-methyltransferase [Natronosporangium hydrolyticum]|uniref:16S rRNA (cytidine(1402)-2'-O)-methyltransferase n=1 Tax=Natronosporangium hydrolyticum TaxID=2811111 RepID=UPI001EFA12CD|nr:16S rRNA (cytidine(1402)-2'-O)-methyltransferase [Natronosporangium hydrolyticum]
MPTPIGNPRDITLRAIDVLSQVDVVGSEDTRHTQRLLKSLGIEVRLLSYHDHNEDTRSRQLVASLLAGMDVALVSDAGTPLVNDPGYRIVTAAITAGVRVCPLPGANAPVTALVGSGLPSSHFYYGGFLPRKGAARRAALASLRMNQATLVFFEAPHRILATLADLLTVLGDRQAALGRNLSKDDEEFLRGPLSTLHSGLAAAEVVRGQFTVVVAGADEASADETRTLADQLIRAMVKHGGTGRFVRDVVRDVSGLPRNWIYEQVQLAEQRSVGGGPGSRSTETD